MLLESIFLGVGAAACLVAAAAAVAVRHVVKSHTDCSQPKKYCPNDEGDCYTNYKVEHVPADDKLKAEDLPIPQQLASYMQEYCRSHLERLSFGRRFLRYDRLGEGEMPVYQRELHCSAHVVQRRGAVPEEVMEGDQVFVPLFEIAAHPSVRFAELKATPFEKLRFNLARSTFKAILREENVNVIRLFVAALDSIDDKSQIVEATELSREVIEEAFRRIEQHGTKVSDILVHGKHVSTLRRLIPTYRDHNVEDLKRDGVQADFWGASIHASSMAEVDSLIFIASPLSGYFAERQPVTAMPVDAATKLRLGVVVFEEIGLAVINSNTCSMIRLKSAEAPEAKAETTEVEETAEDAKLLGI